jgi:hypothetical protein
VRFGYKEDHHRVLFGLAFGERGEVYRFTSDMSAGWQPIDDWTAKHPHLPKSFHFVPAAFS